MRCLLELYRRLNALRTYGQGLGCPTRAGSPRPCLVSTVPSVRRAIMSLTRPSPTCADFTCSLTKRRQLAAASMLHAGCLTLPERLALRCQPCVSPALTSRSGLQQARNPATAAPSATVWVTTMWMLSACCIYRTPPPPPGSHAACVTLNDMPCAQSMRLRSGVCRMKKDLHPEYFDESKVLRPRAVTGHPCPRAVTGHRLLYCSHPCPSSCPCGLLERRWSVSGTACPLWKTTLSFLQPLGMEHILVEASKSGPALVTPRCQLYTRALVRRSSATVRRSSQPAAHRSRTPLTCGPATTLSSRAPPTPS